MTVHVLVVHRLDTEEVPGPVHGLGIVVPDDKGEHPPDPLKDPVHPPFFIAVQDDFSVGLGGEGVARLDQFLS